jgi:hypothetical protein
MSATSRCRRPLPAAALGGRIAESAWRAGSLRLVVGGQRPEAESGQRLESSPILRRKDVVLTEVEIRRSVRSTRNAPVIRKAEAVGTRSVPATVVSALGVSLKNQTELHGLVRAATGRRGRCEGSSPRSHKEREERPPNRSKPMNHVSHGASDPMDAPGHDAAQSMSRELGVHQQQVSSMKGRFSFLGALCIFVVRNTLDVA